MAAPLTTCLWFDDQAEEAARYYVSVFAPDSALTRTQRHTAATTTAGQDTTPAAAAQERADPGGRSSVLLVEFALRGQRFVALNGGPQPWSFNPAVSFQVDCADQAEVDRFWAALGDGGDESAQKCGWVADRYGVSWQVVPEVVKALLASDDREAADRAMTAMMGMKKLDIAALQKAFDNAS
ncbi:3-demethylubiquinone-9 3-methyltransferase [Cordyceps javanica]|uniref:3-demethylubiquinone-9 3-methyltransferase n=1 Tax=Cordyceps javanica TaxID=43265 RepID=A0A545VV34_9HYPO|nr:3-demethylubiquinone-9 3-methyltransferase [Cordyceps javanica]TQW05592.1 3-demethylubiquinone-9 3-methyltransferase [Cordyceps javanica]